MFGGALLRPARIQAATSDGWRLEHRRPIP